MLKRSPYEILGLEDNFTFKDIKKAYRKKIREFPPEQYSKEFMEISDAYESLSNEEYFIRSIKDDIFYLKLDKISNNYKKEDLSIYLKKIFEVPFD